jgi:starvation-inducible DNA-binding protein
MDRQTLETRRLAPLRTPTGLTAEATQDISGAMNALLADVFALYLKTKNFHWHMSGPHFRDYHLMLDDQGDQIIAMTDPIAERVRKIGGTTLRSIGQIKTLQRVLDNDADYVSPEDMLAELRDEPFILYRQVNGSGIKDMLITMCRKAGFEPQPVQEVHRMMAAIQLVAAGLGISVVPQSLDSIQPKSVVYRPLRHDSPVTVPLNLAYRIAQPAAAAAPSTAPDAPQAGGDSAEIDALVRRIDAVLGSHGHLL